MQGPARMNGGGTHAGSGDGAVRLLAGPGAEPPPVDWRALQRATAEERLGPEAGIASAVPAGERTRALREGLEDIAALLPPGASRDELEWYFCRAEALLGLRSALGPMIVQLGTGHGGRNGGKGYAGDLSDLLGHIAVQRRITQALGRVPAVHRATLAAYHEPFRVGPYTGLAFRHLAPVVVRLPAAHALCRQLAGSRRARTLRVCELFEDVLNDGRLGELLLTHVALERRARMRKAKGYSATERRAVMALAKEADAAVIAAFAAYERAKESPPCTAPPVRPGSASRPYTESESWLNAAE
jgi:hypothetical protein